MSRAFIDRACVVGFLDSHGPSTAFEVARGFHADYGVAMGYGRVYAALRHLERHGHVVSVEAFGGRRLWFIPEHRRIACDVPVGGG